MANRAYLVQCDALDPGSGQLNDADVLLAADHAIPFLWLSLFTSRDVKRRKTTVESFLGRAKHVTLPIPVASTEKALGRVERLDNVLMGVVPFPLLRILREWWLLVSTIQKPFIRIETEEVWAMDPDNFSSDLASRLQAFTPKDHYRLTETLQGTPGFASEVSAQGTDQELQQAVLALRGYEWVRPVPWSSVDKPPIDDVGPPADTGDLDWSRLMALSGCPSIGSAGLNALAIADEISRVGPQVYTLLHDEDLLSKRSGEGPYFAFLTWAATDGAALRALRLKVEADTQQSPVVAPRALRPAAWTRTLGELEAYFRSNRVAHNRGGSFRMDGTWVATKLTANDITYFFREREPKRTDLPFAVEVNLMAKFLRETREGQAKRS